MELISRNPWIGINISVVICIGIKSLPIAISFPNAIPITTATQTNGQDTCFPCTRAPRAGMRGSSENRVTRDGRLGRGLRRHDSVIL